MQCFFPREVKTGWQALLQAVFDHQIMAPAKFIERFTREKNNIPLIPECRRNTLFDIFQKTDHADRRRRIDGALRALVVKANIPARHRDLKCFAGFDDAGHRAMELPEDLWLHGIAKIKAVRHTDRPSTGTDNVARRFRDGDLPAFERIKVNIKTIAIG